MELHKLITAPESGWKIGETNTFKVSHSLSCVVLTLDAEGNYTRVSATATTDSTAYSFDVTLEADMIIVVAIAGDSNYDGKINAKDVGLARQHVAKVITFDTLQFAVADVNQDGKVNAKDVGLLRQYVAKVIANFDWLSKS